MTRARIGNRFLFLLCAVTLAVGVAGCGKKSSPRPPEGEESAYTYPRIYPDPAGVLPTEPKAAEPEAEDPGDPTAPGQEGIILFPKSRTTTTYDSSGAR